MKLRPPDSNVTEDQEPFMGVKARRKASRLRDYLGDYIDVPSRPCLKKILEKQGAFLGILNLSNGIHSPSSPKVSFYMAIFGSIY